MITEHSQRRSFLAAQAAWENADPFPYDDESDEFGDDPETDEQEQS